MSVSHTCIEIIHRPSDERCQFMPFRQYPRCTWHQIKYLESQLASSEEREGELKDRLIKALNDFELKDQVITKLKHGLGYYGDPKSWQYPGNDFHDFQIAKEDVGECVWISKKGNEMRGRKAGKLARATLAEVEKIQKERL